MVVSSLNGIEVFVAVVEAGNFAEAAKKMSLTRSAIGKTIARLEKRLGVLLFRRSTRSQSLTKEGALFYEHCQQAIEAVRIGEEALESGKGSISGRVRISMPVLFGQMCLAPILFDLAKEHPDLILDMSFSDRTIDLIEEKFDLAIRNGTLPDSSELSARQLGEHHMVFCASASYLHRRGTPTTLEELLLHDAIAYTRQGRIHEWKIEDSGELKFIRPKSRILIDDMHAIANAAITGLGIAWLPSFQARKHLDSMQLRPVLSHLSSVTQPINALWPYTPHLPLKVRLIVDTLVRELPIRLDKIGI